MLSNLDVLAFVRSRVKKNLIGCAGGVTVKDVAEHFDIPEMNARAHLARLWRNHHIRPIESRDPLGQKIPFPLLGFRMTRNGIKRLKYMRSARPPGGLFDDLFG